MKHFVTIVNAFQPLTIITRSSILDVAAVLDPPPGIYEEHKKIETISCFQELLSDI